LQTLHAGKTKATMTSVDTAETVFPAVPESVAAARRFTRAALARHGIAADIIDTATLLVSELATNAIVHATSTIRLRVGVGDDIRVEVRDASDEAPVVGVADCAHESGRGLAIVTTLAESWDWSPRGNGKVVWFELARA
jgi:anti-sigma regulatory factor (Ser/Thr protein kinase)